MGQIAETNKRPAFCKFIRKSRLKAMICKDNIEGALWIHLSYSLNTVVMPCDLG